MLSFYMFITHYQKGVYFYFKWKITIKEIMKNYTKLRECSILLYLLIKKLRTSVPQIFQYIAFSSLSKKQKMWQSHVCWCFSLQCMLMVTYCLPPKVASRLTGMVRFVLDNSMWLCFQIILKIIHYLKLSGPLLEKDIS